MSDDPTSLEDQLFQCEKKLAYMTANADTLVRDFGPDETRDAGIASQIADLNAQMGSIKEAILLRDAA